MCQNFGFAQRRRRSPNATSTTEQIPSHLSPTWYLPVKPESFSKAVVQPSLYKRLRFSHCVSGKPSWWGGGSQLDPGPLFRGQVWVVRGRWPVPVEALWDGELWALRKKVLYPYYFIKRRPVWVGFVSVHTCWAFGPPENQEENKL